MNTIRKLLFASLLFIAPFAFSQSDRVKPFKCPTGVYEDERTSDPSFNDLLMRACDEINKQHYPEALILLSDAISKDSISSGIANEYLVAQRNKLISHIEKIKEANQGEEKDAQVVKEPEKMEKNDKAEQPTTTKEEVKKKEKEKDKEQPERNKDEESTARKAKKSGSKKATADSEKIEKKEAVEAQSGTATPENEKNNSTPPVIEPDHSETKNEPSPAIPADTAQGRTSSEIGTETVIKSSEEPVAIVPTKEKPAEEIIDEFSNKIDLESRKIDKAAFTEDQLAEFQVKGMQKVTALEGYIKEIANKNNSQTISDAATESAVELFDSEDRTVEVSSISNEEKARHKVRKYFQRLRMLPYDNVEIEWAEFKYTSEFIQGTDGNYYGYVVFRQLFTSSSDNVPAYEDLTTKRTLIILKKYTKQVEGQAIENWDVFLGDISVQQTEKN